MKEGINILLGFPCGSAGKESACNAGDLGSIPGLGEEIRDEPRGWGHRPNAPDSPVRS